MPKIVDHDERRREIVEAAWRVIVERGLEGMTIRAVAHEAGVSNGSIGHYFESRDELVTSAHRMMFARIGQRFYGRVGDATGIRALRAALHESLPLDDERRFEARLDVSYWAIGRVSPIVNEVRRQTLLEWRVGWAALLKDARAAGEITTSTDDEVLVDAIQTMLDGVSMHAVLYPESMPVSRQVQLAETLLRQLTASDVASITPATD